MSTDKELLYSARWHAKKLIDLGKNDPEIVKTATSLYDLLTDALGVGKEPPRPNQPKPGEEPIAMPAFEYSDVKVKARGKYNTPNGKPIGLVVHFTAGAEGDGTVSKAHDTIVGLAKDGYGCMAMSGDGTIVIPKTLGFEKWGAHAGESSWRGMTSISSKFMGMEICNPGIATKVGDKWYPYFMVDSKGKLRKNAKALDEDRVKQFPKQNANVKPGNYVAYTLSQETALVDFILWYKASNPEFDLDNVVGHDEIAPKRKSDPGGCLSWTMPEFRKYLKDLYAQGVVAIPLT